MTWIDPKTTVKTILDGITIPPEAGKPAISKNVAVGWQDVVGRNTSGIITPTFTILDSTKPGRQLDAQDTVREIIANIQVDVWNSAMADEPAYNLNEKMCEQLRQAITANARNPSATIRHLEIVSEAQKNEPGPPLICRTLVMLRAQCYR